VVPATSDEQLVTEGFDRRKSVTVIPAAEAIVAHVSPCLAVTVRVQAAAAWCEKPRAKSKRLLVSNEATMV